MDIFLAVPRGEWRIALVMLVTLQKGTAVSLAAGTQLRSGFSQNSCSGYKHSGGAARLLAGLVF